MIASHRKQQGTVLVLSLLILLVMTTLGVKAILGSNLQERLAVNQKQTIEATLAAESGAALAIQWLRTHPEAWGDAGAWKNDPTLPSRASAISKGTHGPIHWIERIDFHGDTATIVSRGGIQVGNEILAQRTVTAGWQGAGPDPELAPAASEPAGMGLGGVGLQTPGAGVDREPTRDFATVREAVGNPGGVAVPDDHSQTRKPRGNILFWKLSTGDGG